MEKKDYWDYQNIEIEINKFQNELGKILKAYRRKQQLSILEMSQITGISINHLSKLENGKINSPSLRNYLKILSVIEINKFEFIDLINEYSIFFYK